MKDLIFSITTNTEIPASCQDADPNGVPTEFQYLPPGRHMVRPTKDGKPVELNVAVTSDTVDRLNRSLDSLRASGGDPFIDFNHNDSEASGWLQSFRWGGDDPLTGGVRAIVKWTAKGLEALKGRMYRKFSPTFFMDDDGEISGTTLNAGGLVNRPAFTSISPVVASQTKPEKKGKEMSDELKDAQATIRAKEVELAHKQEIQAKELEIKTINAKVSALEQENEKLTNDLKAQAKANAETIVEAACADGRIPPKDDETRTMWVDLIAADPSKKVLLAKMPKSQVLGKTVLAKTSDGESHSTNTDKSDAEQYVAKVNERVPELKSAENGIDSVNRDFPKLHKAWFEAGGKPGLKIQAVAA